MHAREEERPDGGAIARLNFKRPLTQTAADRICDRLSWRGSRSEVGPSRGMTDGASDRLPINGHDIADKQVRLEIRRHVPRNDSRDRCELCGVRGVLVIPHDVLDVDL